jgi:hypothetical protein
MQILGHIAFIRAYAQGLEQLISPDLREEIRLRDVVSGDEIDPLLVGIQGEEFLKHDIIISTRPEQASRMGMPMTRV